ncbi:hypothetical protein GQ457_09G018250 [Hibiscus cannabinus]
MFRNVLDEFWMAFGVFAAQICAFLVLSIGTSMVVSVPIPLWNPYTDATLLVPVSVPCLGYRYRLTLVSVPPFEYRYWKPGNSFWGPLKHDSLHYGP